MTDTTTVLAKATELGKEHGTNAAEFELQYIIGGRVPANLDVANAKTILKNYERDGYLEGAPTADLSGEWADGLTPHQLVNEVAGYTNVPAELEAEICTQYEVGFNEAATETIVKACQNFLSEKEE